MRQQTDRGVQKKERVLNLPRGGAGASEAAVVC
jgi:hypothetical protein